MSKIEDETLVEELANGITHRNEVSRPTGHLISSNASRFSEVTLWIRF